MRHKETDPFYLTHAWRALRQKALDRDCGLCVWCRDAGRYTRDRLGRRVPVLATMVHHVKPRKEFPKLALELSNLVSLCDKCHDEAHPEKREKAAKPKPPSAAEVFGIRIEKL